MSMGEIALSVLKAKPIQMGQIENISKGGLAFRYTDSELETSESSELDILFTQDVFHLKQVPFNTIWDFDAVNESPLSPIVMRYRGVQFGEMMPDQKSLLDYFVKNHTIGEA